MTKNDTRAARGAALFVLGGLAAPAFATTYVVDTLADVSAADGQLSLREAVMAASTNAAVGDAPAGEATGDSISFASALSGGTIALTASLPSISDDLALAGDVTISGESAFQIFSIDAAGEPVTLSDLVLANGTAVSGGALSIASGSTVALNGVTVRDNVGTGAAATNGGAIDNAGTLTVAGGSFLRNAATGASGSGGAIISSGTLSVSGTRFSGNTANRAGGGIEIAAGPATTLTNVEAFGNEVGTSPGNGGFLHISGAVNSTVEGGTFANNIAGQEGGALWNNAGTMTINGTSFTGNVANGPGTDDGNGDLIGEDGGGALFNQGGTMIVSNAVIDGNTALGVSATGGGILNNGGTLTVSDSTIRNNLSNRAGGGIEDNAREAATTVTLSNVTLSGNGAGVGTGTVANPGNGGALHVSGPGTINVAGGTVSGNTAAREGGGLWNGSGLMSIDGGTFTANAANGDAGDDGGGALFNQGGDIVITGGTVISGNSALGASGSGGGIFNNEGTVSMTGGSITGNVANRAGGGIEDRSTANDTTNGVPTVLLTEVALDGNSAGVTLGSLAAVAAPGNGGGLHITGDGGGTFGGFVSVVGGTVSNNVAAAEGAGLWNFGAPSILAVDGTTLDANDAQGDAADNGGGALFNNGGVMTVANATITNNVASGASGSGGGVLNFNGTLTITGSTLTNNGASRAGGALEDVSSTSATTVTITESTMASNMAGNNPGNGGALHITGGASTVTVDRSTVWNNLANNEGGGLWVFAGSTLNLWNSTVFGNGTAEQDGSGTRNEVGGGLLLKPGAIVNAVNATIASNMATTAGGGVFLDAAPATPTPPNTLTTLIQPTPAAPPRRDAGSRQRPASRGPPPPRPARWAG